MRPFFFGRTQSSFRSCKRIVSGLGRFAFLFAGFFNIGLGLRGFLAKALRYGGGSLVEEAFGGGGTSFA